MSNMPRKLLPSVLIAISNMPSSRLWRRRSPAKDEKLPNEKSVPCLRSERQSELLGRRSVDKNGRRGRRSVLNNASNVNANGGIALEIGRENVTTEIEIAAGTGSGPKSAVIETGIATGIGIALVIVEIEFDQETARETAQETVRETAQEIACETTREIDTGGGGASETEVMGVQKRSRNNFPKRSCLAWRRRLWLIYYATVSV